MSDATPQDTPLTGAPRGTSADSAVAASESILAAAQRVADDVLAPAAEHVDTSASLPRGHLAALADAGLFGLAGPIDAGGCDADPATFRRAMAAIAGGCGATFFVWAQHHGVVRTLRAAGETSLLRELCAGTTVAGTAFAHLRRPRPAITAARVPGGWRFDGVAPWATSWGIASHFTIAAVASGDSGTSAGSEVVWALVEAPTASHPGPVPDGLVAEPLDLPVLSATGTVVFRLDGLFVPNAAVLHTEPRDEWRRVDRLRAAPGQPATLGVAARATRLLAEYTDATLDADAMLTAEALERDLAAAWREDDRLLAGPDRTTADRAAADEVFVAAASAHRANCLGLASRATTALLAAVGGRGMDRSHPAQRLAREAAFYVIQAQTADGRRATLAAAAHRG